MKQLSLFSLEPAPCEKAHWILYIDGASRGNPGLAAAGIFLLKNQEPIARKGYFLGTKTNNQAEYLALIYGLRLFKEHVPQKKDHLTVYSDSELLVRQIKGIYKIKNADLKKLYEEALALLQTNEYKIEHVRRENNIIADGLANKALDEHKTKK